MATLSVDRLSVSFATPSGTVRAVNELSFDVGSGRSLGIVGESGSGKSQTALAIMGLLAGNAQVSGAVRFDEVDLLQLSTRELNRYRGPQIGMIFQDPMTCLNPHLSIGRQMSEVLEVHEGLARRAALARCKEMLDAVNISGASKRLDQFPHELSGGMRQRVMIAMALLCRPKVLIADEPTTALDVTVQAQILELMRELRREFNLSIVLISHDLGVVGELCEDVLVMYAGSLMESAPTTELLRAPSHPYTRGLVACLPQLDTPVDQPLNPIPGSPPEFGASGSACPFADRCPVAELICHEQAPVASVTDGRTRACHRSVDEILAEPIA